MERLFVIIFLLSILPYLGIPNQYDMPIIILLFVWLLYSVYLIGKKHAQLHAQETGAHKNESETKTDNVEETEIEKNNNDLE